MDPITVARIDRASGDVLNIEMAWPAWVAEQEDDPDFIFVPYTPVEPAIVGLTYDESTGFEQPVVEEA